MNVVNMGLLCSVSVAVSVVLSVIMLIVGVGAGVGVYAVVINKKANSYS